MWYRRSVAAAAKSQNAGYITGEVQRGDLEVSVDAQGTLAMSVERDVLTKSGGTVDTLAVVEGDEVAAGQVIARLSNSSLDSSVEKLELDLQTLENQLNDLLNPSSEDVTKASLALKQADLDLQAKTLDQENLSVAAPISGTILSVSANVGDDLAASKALCTLQDDNSLSLVVPLSQLRVNGVTVGDTVTITFDSLRSSGEYHRTGTAKEIGQTAYAAGSDTVVDITVSLPSSAV